MKKEKEIFPQQFFHHHTGSNVYENSGEFLFQSERNESEREDYFPLWVSGANINFHISSKENRRQSISGGKKVHNCKSRCGWKAFRHFSSFSAYSRKLFFRNFSIFDQVFLENSSIIKKQKFRFSFLTARFACVVRLMVERKKNP